MKLLNVNLARAIWLFPMSDLNPTGRAVREEGFAAIADRYKFHAVPTVLAAIELQRKNEPVVFGGGAFTSKSGEPVAIDLKIYNDGLIAESRSNTVIADAFLKDLFVWAPSALGFPKTSVSVQKKLFASELYIECAHELTTINPKLAKFAKSLAEAVSAESPKSYELSGLQFSTNPKDGTQLVNFRLERQVNTNFELHRYFSAAPMHTDAHLALLSEFEKLLKN